MNEPASQASEPMVPESSGLVSVVIPCYNQGRFLCDAIGSVVRQTYRAFEIIVVDDGSTDNTRQVALGQAVRYVSQSNQGLSAARNRGIREGLGEFFVFLDADDLLLPAALEAGVHALIEHPDCAFAYGDFREIDPSGAILVESNRASQQFPDYRTLLKANCIQMHATVTYRTGVFAEVGTFDSDLKACEDYEMYLRVVRRLPICHFSVLVAEYRIHETNMSRDPGLMLRTVLQVLHKQKPYVSADRQLTEAYTQGLREFAGAFAVQLARRSWIQLFSEGNSKESMSGFGVLLRYYPVGTMRRFFSLCRRRLSSLLH